MVLLVAVCGNCAAMCDKVGVVVIEGLEESVESGGQLGERVVVEVGVVLCEPVDGKVHELEFDGVGESVRVVLRASVLVGVGMMLRVAVGSFVAVGLGVSVLGGTARLSEMLALLVDVELAVFFWLDVELAVFMTLFVGDAESLFEAVGESLFVSLAVSWGDNVAVDVTRGFVEVLPANVSHKTRFTRLGWTPVQYRWEPVA